MFLVYFSMFLVYFSMFFVYLFIEVFFQCDFLISWLKYYLNNVVSCKLKCYIKNYSALKKILRNQCILTQIRSSKLNFPIIV